MIYSENQFYLFKRTRSGKSIWYYYYLDENGVRKDRSTGATNKHVAIQVISQRIKEGTFADKKKREITFREFAQPFWNPETCPILQSKIKRGGKLSKQYIKDNKGLLDLHIMPFFEKRIVAKITPSLIENWILDLPVKNKISNKRANDAYNVLNQMLDHAVLQRILPSNPCKEVKRLIATENKRGCFTEKQVNALFSAKWENEMAYTACLLAATTGMRMGEIRALTVEQIHDDFINVNASWSQVDNRKSTKSGKDRVVPICKDIHDMLFKIAPQKSGLIFTLNGETPVDHKFISERLKARMDELNNEILKENKTAKKLFDYTNEKEPLSFHSFRHFFNTRLVASGIEGEIIRATIGHESEEMTEHYLHLQASDMTAIQKIQNAIMSKSA